MHLNKCELELGWVAFCSSRNFNVDVAATHLSNKLVSTVLA